jgi:cytochrome b561
MTPAMRPRGYSALQIILHWVIAVTVLVQLVSGESMTALVEAGKENRAPSVFDQQFGALHYWFGIGILLLVATRLVLRLVKGVPARDLDMPRWMARASIATHWMFYVLLFVVPVIGLLGYYIGDPYGELHVLAKPPFIVLILLHASAAVYHQFVRKDGLLKRMIIPDSR